MSPVDAKGNYVPDDEVRDDAAVASAARTTTGTSATFNAGKASSLEGVLTVTAASGTSPTLDVRLETSTDGGTSWETVASFAQATGVVTRRKVCGPLGDVCRWAWTVAGATPSFTFSITAEANR